MVMMMTTKEKNMKKKDVERKFCDHCLICGHNFKKRMNPFWRAIFSSNCCACPLRNVWSPRFEILVLERILSRSSNDRIVFPLFVCPESIALISNQISFFS